MYKAQQMMRWPALCPGVLGSNKVDWPFETEMMSIIGLRDSIK